ncbi:hypothetical protein ACLK19_03920 [Escherichia coli]
MTVADVQLFVTPRWAGRWLAKRWKGLPVIPLICVIRKAGADSPQALPASCHLMPMKQQITLADVAATRQAAPDRRC